MNANYWEDYRKTTGDMTWRLAIPEDQPAIDKIRETSERFLNEKQKVPDLFAIPIMLVLVAEDANGTIVDALYIEAMVEVVKMGCSATSFTETAGLDADLYAWLRGLGLQTATVRTRKSMKDKMRAVLLFLGFHCEDEDFSHWTRHL